MTEKERMQQGLVYDARDSELTKLRRQARMLCEEFNACGEANAGKRQDILCRLLGSMGSDIELLPDIRFDYGFHTYIGDQCGFNFNCTILDCAPVRFGRFVMVGPNSAFLTPLHPMIYQERIFVKDRTGKLFTPEYCAPITVGDHVWMGGGVTVNGGVTIGKNSVIGSGSVVTRDIPENVFAAGNPCRVIRPITEQDRLKDSVIAGKFDRIF